MYDQLGSSVNFSAKGLWEKLVERMDLDERFGNAFNRRKAWEKPYYNLTWKSPEPHLLATYRFKDRIVRVGIYNDTEEDLARIRPHISEIEREIGAEFKYRHRDGRASDYWIEYEITGDSTLSGIVDWIVEWALKIKESIDRNVNDIASQAKPIAKNSYEFFPSLDEYDPGISRDQYIDLFLNSPLIKKDLLDTVYYIFKMGGEASCLQVSKRFGNTAQHYNANGMHAGRQVHLATGCPLSNSDDEGNSYWSVLFQGRYSKNKEEGAFIWRIRKPLAEAIEALDKEEFFYDFEKKDESAMNNKKAFALNTILCGPPGTGKTYNTVAYALAIINGKSVEEMQAEVSARPDEAWLQFHKHISAGRIGFVTFHQSYGYEEFIEGIKPNVDEDSQNISYSIEPGVFKRFCDRAMQKVDARKIFDSAWDKLFYAAVVKGEYEFTRHTGNTFIAKVDSTLEKFYIPRPNSQNDITKSAVFKLWTTEKEDLDYLAENHPGTAWRRTVQAAVIAELKEKCGLPDYSSVKNADGNYVFIIDEINRGNISKIFGELITLIEETKRKGEEESTSVILPYSGEEFSVPNNVYILGTMNTADRSIALMDTALRRRFNFVEMMPRPELLRDIKVSADGETLSVSDMLETINKRIEYLYDREHTIGHAFFINKLKGKNATVENLAEVFKNNIIPLLQEYFYEDYSKIQLVLGDDDKSSDDYKFILDTRAKESEIFKKSPQLDLHENIYMIQDSAFYRIQSYIEITEHR